MKQENMEGDKLKKERKKKSKENICLRVDEKKEKIK